MTGPVALTVDVSAAMQLPGALLSASVVLPSAPANGIAVVCHPGGGLRKDYFHLEVPGFRGYSMAAYLAERGYVTVAIEHLGTGESTRPPGSDDMSLATMARGDAAAARHLLGRVTEGSVPGQSAPIAIHHTIGMGHSMGGGGLCVQQDLDRTYDGLIVLGFPVTWPVRPVAEGKPARDPSVTAARRLQSMARDWAPFYRLDRSITRSFFHLADVPDEVIAFDDSLDTPIPTRAAVEGLTAGVVSAAAARIEVPVFLGFALMDADPEVLVEVPYDIGREVGAYQASVDVTAYRLVGSGHAHNTAGTRELLWNRLHQWAGSGGLFAS